MKINIDADIPDRWVPTFLGFLNSLTHLSKIGSSREVAIYADGDGDFHPEFQITSDDELPDASEPSKDEYGNFLFDAG